MRKLATQVLFVPLAVMLLCGATAELARVPQPLPSPRFTRPAGVLFADDFSDGLRLWDPDREGVWSIHRGVLVAILPDERQERSFLYAGSEDWTDYAVDLDVMGMRGVDKGVAVRVQGQVGLGIDLRGPGYQDVIVQRREWPIGRASVVNANGVWHHVRVEVQGPTIRVFVNGERLLEKKDGKIGRLKGRIALAAYTGGIGECTVFYDNVVVTPLR